MKVSAPAPEQIPELPAPPAVIPYVEQPDLVFDYTKTHFGNRAVVNAEKAYHHSQAHSFYKANAVESQAVVSEKQQVEQQLSRRSVAGRLLGRMSGSRLELEAVRDTAAEFLATSDPEATAKAADSHGQMKQYAERDLAANLIGLRMSLREMPAEKATVIDKYFEHGVPDILRRGNKGHSDAPRPWNEWLADSYLGASDAQLLNLLQWHVNSMDEIAEHPDVTAEVASLRGEYRQKVGQALADGWLVQRHQGDHMAKLDDIEVRFGDVFDTLLQNRLGYFVAGQDAVIISANRSDPDKGEAFHTVRYLRDSLMHEYNHALIQDFGKDDPVWMYEAMTEHINLVLKGGELEVMAPEFRTADRGAYADSRRLTDALLNGGSRVVPVRLATRDYSGGAVERKDMNVALDAAWGTYNVIKKVDAHMSQTIEAISLKQPELDAMVVMEMAAAQTEVTLRYTPDAIFAVRRAA
jgi:hypothetical protein